MPNPSVTENLHGTNCGECLIERVEVVKLVDGVCPVCGTDYQHDAEVMSGSELLSSGEKEDRS